VVTGGQIPVYHGLSALFNHPGRTIRAQIDGSDYHRNVALALAGEPPALPLC